MSSRRAAIAIGMWVYAGAALAEAPEAEAQRCRAIIGLAAEGRALDMVDGMWVGRKLDPNLHEANETRRRTMVRYLEEGLTRMFKIAGEIAQREPVPDTATDDPGALIVRERWTYRDGRSNWIGCVRHQVGDEWATSFQIADQGEGVSRKLRDWMALKLKD